VQPPILLADQPSPIHWLVRRRRGVLPLVWLAGLIGLLHLGLFSVMGRAFGMGFSYGVSWTVGLVSSASMGALFAWAAARFFVHTRRSGELELLLPTPGGAKAMIDAQWDILKRLVTGPVILMLLPALPEWGVIGMGRRHGVEDAWRIYFAIYSVVHLTNIVLTVRALCWVGLWFGFRTGVLSRAVIWTVALVDGPPQILALLCSALTMPLLSRGGLVSPFMAARVLGTLVPQILVLVYYLWIVGVARRQLAYELSVGETVPLRRMFLQAFGLLPVTVRRMRQWGPS
jgi:hypothetical protein